jgi:hypothetical protein
MATLHISVSSLAERTIAGPAKHKRELQQDYCYLLLLITVIRELPTLILINGNSQMEILETFIKGKRRTCSH